MRLTKAAIHTARHPAGWERASCMLICRPGKDDFSQLKTYCYILLWCGMGKVVEKVVAKLLSKEAERRGLLCNGQLRTRHRWSAIDAVAIMVDRALAAWQNHHITGVHLRDIKAAFPNVAKRRLANSTKVRQMDGNHTRRMESFLLSGTVEMIIEGNPMERHPVEAGVPQGSPVSPILCAINTSGLIKWFKEYVSKAGGLFCFNNLGSVATGSDVNQVFTILERCAAKSIEGASGRGQQLDTAKTEAA